MLQWQNTPKHVKALTLFGIYLFDVIPAFDLFSVFLNRSGIAFSDDGSEAFLNCLFEALHEAPGLGKTAMLAEFARFCIYPGAKIEIDSDRPCFSVQERPQGHKDGTSTCDMYS